MKKVLIRLTCSIAAICVLSGLLVPVAANAAQNLLGPACIGKDGKQYSGTGNSAGCKTEQADKLTGPSGIIHDITQLVAIGGGIAGVVMIMVGGFMYVTSGGESGKLTTAKNTIVYALIGLVVIALARTIIFFVLSKV